MSHRSEQESRTQGPKDPSPPGTERDTAPSDRQVADAIGEQLLSIQHESYGGGAETVETHFVGDTLIVLMDGLELLPAENLLVESGMDEAVSEIRTQYQNAIEHTFRAAVERSTGRRVVAFSSHVHLRDPRFAVEIFRLAPG
jgi:uncharacterized protein YbcI